jgi:isocitrate lyase
MTTFYDLVPAAAKGRFDGIERNYTADDVLKLRGSVQIQHTLAERGAAKLWELINMSLTSMRWAPCRATRPCRWFARA